ncbi:MAG: hypothetical protein Q4A93_04530 [Actinomycetota bacterium]|nr:hypothetical protein [Actinomycetota bacterium]
MRIEAVMNLEDYIKDLSPELQEKARACGSAEELVALAKEAQVPLPEEALAAIAGGDDADPENCAKPTCPKCGHHNISEDYLQGYHHCNYCGYEW